MGKNANFICAHRKFWVAEDLSVFPGAGNVQKSGEIDACVRKRRNGGGFAGGRTRGAAGAKGSVVGQHRGVQDVGISCGDDEV